MVVQDTCYSRERSWRFRCSIFEKLLSQYEQVLVGMETPAVRLCFEKAQLNRFAHAR
jgi:hypothetical protein